LNGGAAEVVAVQARNVQADTSSGDIDVGDDYDTAIDYDAIPSRMVRHILRRSLSLSNVSALASLSSHD
jgi:hypothetical protein